MVPTVEVTRRRRCRDSVDLLIEEADATSVPIPTTSRGTGAAPQPPTLERSPAPTSPERPPTPAPTEPERPPHSEAPRMDSQLTSGKEIPGARIMYRLGQNIDLDYGPNVNVNNLIPQSMLVSSEFVNNISKCTARCHICKYKLLFQTVGFGLAKTFTAKCSNSNCKFDSTFSNLSDRLGPFFLNNLAAVYQSLLNDDGYKGLTTIANSVGINSVCKGSYYNHCKYIYQMYQTFYDDNVPKVHQDVKNFYARNYNLRPDFARGESLDIAVSLDGTYAHIGHHSRFGASFINEALTGRLLDVNLLEKCFSCDNHNIYESNGTCPNKLFHGCSGSMEVENAKILFTRSPTWGFRYTTYIADGDCKVYPKLKDLNLYTVPIEKTECANHMAKRAQKLIKKLG